MNPVVAPALRLASLAALIATWPPTPDDPHPVAPTTETIFGISSLIFWSVTIVVAITYVALVMRCESVRLHFRIALRKGR
jgi:K+ potassium transporter